MSTIVPHKRCNKCGNEYPQNAHFFNFRHKDSRFDGYCRGCKAKWSIDYFQYVILRDVLFQRGYRQCSCCNKILPANDLFYYPSRQRGGLSTQCRGCHMNWSAEHFQVTILYRVINRRGYKRCTDCKKILPTTREFFNTVDAGLNGTDSACRVCAARQNKEFRQRKGKEWVRQKTRDYFNRHPGLMAHYGRERRKNKPEYVRELCRLAKARRKAKLRKLPYDFCHADYDTMKSYWQNRCAISGRRGVLHLDHWIPVAYEGADNPGTVAANLVPLLKEYNLSKRHSIPAVWLREKFGEIQAAEIEQRIEAYFEWVKQRKSQSV